MSATTVLSKEYKKMLDRILITTRNHCKLSAYVRNLMTSPRTSPKVHAAVAARNLGLPHRPALLLGPFLPVRRDGGGH